MSMPSMSILNIGGVYNGVSLICLKPSIQSVIILSRHTRFLLLRLFPDTQVSSIRSGIMISKVSIALALVGTVVVSAQATNDTCDTSLLNTTSSSYYVGIANKTIYDIAVEVNRGVCDIGRANLSSFHFFNQLERQLT